jgi:GTP cyclohydrolase II
MTRATALKPPRSSSSAVVRRYAEANVPTEYGTIRLLVYPEEAAAGREVAPPIEHMAITCGDVGGDDVLVRVHSECWTGEVLHSLKCECREQLDVALRAIASEGRGAVFYLRQEGRGIGLGDKIRAYKLQEQGVDTVDANRMLGLPDDTRRYHAAAFMARDLGIRSVRLLTNNPEKVQRLRAEGVPITERVPVHIEPNEHNVGYLLAKSRRMGHALSIVGAPVENGAAISDAIEAARDVPPGRRRGRS